MSGFKFFALLFYFILTSLLYPQGTDSVKNMQGSILKSYDKKIIKSENKNSDALFFSIKGGYHYDFPDNDYGLKGSWVFDASIGALMNKHLILGVNFDYWKIATEDYHLKGSSSSYNRNFKGEGVVFFIKYRIILFNKFNVEPGAGAGPYRISYSNNNGDYTASGYLNLCAKLGFNMKILDFKIGSKNLDLHIDSEISYYSLVTLANGKNLYMMINFKIGPTIYLYY